MLDDRKHIDKLFSDGLSGYEETMSSYSWENIASELGKDKKQKNKFFFYRIAAGIALLITFGMGYFVMWIRTDTMIAEALENHVLQQTSIHAENKMFIAENETSDNTHKIKTKEVKDAEQVPVIEKQSHDNVLANTVSDTNILPVSFVKNEIQIAEDIATPENIVKGQSIITNIDSLVQLANSCELYAYVPLSPKKEWEMGGILMPSFSVGDFPQAEYGTLSMQKSNDGTEDKFSKDNLEITYSTGLGLRRLIKNKFSLNTGIYYSKIGDRYEHVEIPLGISYQNLGKPVDFNLLAGVSVGTITTNGLEEYSRFDYNLYSGFGLGVHLTDQFSFVIEPVVKFRLPLNYNYFYYQRPLSFAIRSGLTYKF